MADWLSVWDPRLSRIGTGCIGAVQAQYRMCRRSVPLLRVHRTPLETLWMVGCVSERSAGARANHHVEHVPRLSSLFCQLMPYSTAASKGVREVGACSHLLMRTQARRMQAVTQVASPAPFGSQTHQPNHPACPPDPSDPLLTTAAATAQPDSPLTWLNAIITVRHHVLPHASGRLAAAVPRGHAGRQEHLHRHSHTLAPRLELRQQQQQRRQSSDSDRAATAAVATAGSSSLWQAPL